MVKSNLRIKELVLHDEDSDHHNRTPKRAARKQKDSPAECRDRVNDTMDKLLRCMSAERVMKHLVKFQDIANQNGGRRDWSSKGYEQSAKYISSLLEAHNYSVSIHPFVYPNLEQNVETAILERGANEEERKQYVNAFLAADDDMMTHFAPVHFSGSGDVRGRTLSLGEITSHSSFGCQSTDFERFEKGSIAILRHGGGCLIRRKITNARSMGAIGMAIHLAEGKQRGELPEIVYQEPFLDATFAKSNFPVIAITFEVAMELANTTCRIFVNNSLVDLESYNVIAESRTGDPNHVVLVGAHLDGSKNGPGIEDNGTGAAALVEVALGMAKLHPTRRLRFAWWGAEEDGLIGSMAYARERNYAAGVSVYLNVDMIGSQNYVFGIHGNFSDTQGPTSVLEEFYKINDIPYQEIPNVTCRSDACHFHLQGIPAAGITSVSIPMRKTATEASLYGGTAGELYDSCYHLPCDNLTNVNSYPLEINTEAVAYAAMVYAMKQVPGNGDAVHAAKVLAPSLEPVANATLTFANRSMVLLYPVVQVGIVLLCLKWGHGRHRSCRRRYDTALGRKYRKP
eukprot:scaffold11606_cov56-Attheya_sp.AAC.5